jgi:hypothetical protein
VVRLTQGSPPALVSMVAEDIIKPNRVGEPEAGLGTEGDRSTDSTEDSGPKKPGNGVEDKTLTTRIYRGAVSTENPPLATVNTQLFQNWTVRTWAVQDCRWTVESRGREVMVTPLESRLRVTML